MVLANDNAFRPFDKIARLKRESVCTEKLDGTNGQIYIFELGAEPVETFGPDMVSQTDTLAIVAGSRSRYLTYGNKHADNFGFGRWVHENAAELAGLGPGRHYGEWWGQGIQRGYGLKEKRFSLFNVGRWLSHDDTDTHGTLAPACCHVVPTLYRGAFDT